MGYQLGVDAGTTYTAAAVHRDGRVEVVGLGDRAMVVPSVLYLRANGEVLAGDAANRRSLIDPARAAREFKRRLGDPVPVLVGGAPYGAEVLTARLLRWVIDRVADGEGARPDSLAVTHPANWGDYKLDLLRQAVDHAGFGAIPVTFVSEPEAAAVHYAGRERVPVGAAVAVYDLGGGTFDATVLRRTTTGFELLGRPQGIERLGGIDFDAAVLAHLDTALNGAVSALDPDDAAAVAAIAQLRADIVAAKEALSADADTQVTVHLTTASTAVRLTRRELESLIRPALAETIAALRRAIDSAGVTAAELHAVLLTGGSSRIPLVAELVTADLGRPVVVDAHPKHVVAQGAAVVAAVATGAGAYVVTVVAAPEPGPTGAVLPDRPADVPSPAAPEPAPATAGRGGAAAGPSRRPVPATAAVPSAPPVPDETGATGDRRTRVAVGVGLLVMVVAMIVAVGYSRQRDDDVSGGTAAATRASPADGSSTTAGVTTTAPVPPPSTGPAPVSETPAPAGDATGDTADGTPPGSTTPPAGPAGPGTAPPVTPASVPPPGPEAAPTSDGEPCDAIQTTRVGHQVQFCPLYTANVPVYNSPDLGVGAVQVGTLVEGGRANWFVGQSYRSEFFVVNDDGSVYRNHWWAFTLADNDEWGWVPQVYFSGGEDDERDAGLFLCDTMGNACTP